VQYKTHTSKSTTAYVTPEIYQPHILFRSWSFEIQSDSATIYHSIRFHKPEGHTQVLILPWQSAHLLICRPWRVTDGLVASISTWRLDSSQDRPC